MGAYSIESRETTEIIKKELKGTQSGEVGNHLREKVAILDNASWRKDNLE